MIIVEDNFFENADEVREMALSRLFFWGNIKRNAFPGMRTLYQKEDQVFRVNIKNRLEKILNRDIWATSTTSGSMCFTIGFEHNEKTNWIHQDVSGQTQKKEIQTGGEAYAGLIYLTPNPPANSGTELIMFPDPIGLYATEIVQVPQDGGRPHVQVENVYNRLILYPARYWHRPMVSGFGTNKKNARLIMNLFLILAK